MTPFSLSTLADIKSLSADTIIDVRAPAEFAEDHVPGAINLPVLSDDERARVGTIYVQDSPFKARKIGAALVARCNPRGASSCSRAVGRARGHACHRMEHWGPRRSRTAAGSLIRMAGGARAIRPYAVYKPDGDERRGGRSV